MARRRRQPEPRDRPDALVELIGLVGLMAVMFAGVFWGIPLLADLILWLGGH